MKRSAEIGAPVMYMTEDGTLVDASEVGHRSSRGRVFMAALIGGLFLLLLAVIAMLFGLIGTSRAERATGVEPGVTWVRSIYGYGPEASQMVEPSSAAIDPTGGFWLGDQGRFRMVRFDASGRMLEIFSGDEAADEMFDFPSRIAIAPDGWRYVAQGTYDTVKVYDEAGAYQHTLRVPAPTSVAVNDDMVVVGYIAGYIAFERDGTPIGQIGERGIGEGQFDTVNGIALDDANNVYVVDTFNNRISKYDELGDVVWTVETGPPANQGGPLMDAGAAQERSAKYPAGMQMPMGATIDASNRLVVIDLLDFTASAFSLDDGAFIDKWGTFGREDGKLMYPADIDYDARYDWFVVSDSGNQRGQIILLPDSGGTPLEAGRRIISGPFKACGIPFLVLVVLLIVWRLLSRRRSTTQVGRVDANTETLTTLTS